MKNADAEIIQRLDRIEAAVGGGGGSGASAANQTSGAQKSQIVDGSGNVIGSTGNALDINLKSGNVTLNAQDIEIGGVELKDGTVDTRAKIGALSGLASGDNGLPVTDPIANAAIGTTASAAVTNPASSGSVVSFLKGLLTQLQAAIPAGTNLIGKFGIDQTTPGTTNGVQVNAALPAGTALLGKVGIDQTTDGTTNKVYVPALAPKTPSASQVSCTSTSTTLWSAVATGQIVEIFNNGIYPLWLRSDNGAPVADTATYPASNGNGLGIMVQPASYWSSDVPIVTGGKGIVLSTASLVTVQLYPN